MTEIIRNLSDAHFKTPSVLTIGSFDGVHRGHAHLIQTVVDHAREKNAKSVVVTLNPHPRLVLRPDVPLQLISTLDERLDLLSHQPLDYVVVFPFSLEQSKLRAREFVQLMCEHLNMMELVCGPNFALGYKREGTIPVLQELGNELGFTITVIEPQQFEQGIISSTRIRDLVANGQVSAAAQLLGRYPMLRGVVVHGDHRGRELGYPTANLDVPDRKLIPANGIYAVRVRLGDQWFDGAASVGVRPTFGGGKRLVEIYLFDFARWIYGEELEVYFVERLRDEEKFDSIPALLEQMSRDVENARTILKQFGNGAPQVNSPRPSFIADSNRS
ncbi:MAG TPA: bifunctional riboflavin kinase/FAD synthetase [Anaerolineae bacterium]|nr:bifunctional riboflavin kinase/FAD synthetase [Anaerolineae bacterium]